MGSPPPPLDPLVSYDVQKGCTKSSTHAVTCIKPTLNDRGDFHGSSENKCGSTPLELSTVNVIQPS